MPHNLRGALVILRTQFLKARETHVRESKSKRERVSRTSARLAVVPPRDPITGPLLLLSRDAAIPPLLPNVYRTNHDQPHCGPSDDVVATTTSHLCPYCPETPRLSRQGTIFDDNLCLHRPIVLRQSLSQGPTEKTSLDYFGRKFTIIRFWEILKGILLGITRWIFLENVVAAPCATAPHQSPACFALSLRLQRRSNEAPSSEPFLHYNYVAKA
ncbi:hypothetical protein NL676_018278 [Syzygium grande]|nr:hypothetical protein NL676_018278 [Syzygium grande]